MARLTLNQNIAQAGQQGLNDLFSQTYWGKEIVVCNDPKYPGIYVMIDRGEEGRAAVRINDAKYIRFTSDSIGSGSTGYTLEDALTEIKTEITNIVNEGSSSGETIVKIINSVGLNADGTYPKDKIDTAKAQYIGEAKDVIDALLKLDAALKLNEGATTEYINQQYSASTAYTDAKISELDYDGYSADAGSVVTKVSQTDGIISVTGKKLSVENGGLGTSGTVETYVYNFKLGDDIFGTINLPREQFLSAVTFISAATPQEVQEAYQHGVTITEGQPYLKFVWKLTGDSFGYTYVNVSDMIAAFDATDIKLSSGYTKEDYNIKSGTTIESAISNIVGQLVDLHNVQAKSALVSSGGTIKIDNSTDKTDISVHIDNDTIVPSDSVSTLGQLRADIKLSGVTYTEGKFKKSFSVVTGKGTKLGDEITIPRDYVSGDTFVNVTSATTVEGNDTYTVRLKICEVINNAEGSSIENGNGLATAWGVKTYVRDGLDGDGIMVGDDTLTKPAASYYGPIDFNFDGILYDTVHEAFVKTDNNLKRLDESLGFPADGDDVHKYPQPIDAHYIDETKNVMEALGAIDETLYSQATQDELTSDTETILVQKHENGSGTTIDLHIHGNSAETNTVAVENDDVVGKDKNFLTQDKTSKGMKVNGMDSDVTVTTENIRILGWENQVGGGVYSNWGGKDVPYTGQTEGVNFIPSGTSIQEILVNLFSRIMYPKAATRPTCRLNGTTNLGYVEVGSTVRTPLVTVVENGHGSFNADYTNVTQPRPEYSWVSDKISTTVTGFTGFATQTQGENVQAQSVKIVDGTNTISINAEKVYGKPTNTPIRNDSGSTTQTASTAPEYSASWTGGTATTSGNITATGVYPVYSNGKYGQVKNLDAPIEYSTNKSNVTQTYPGATFYIGFASQKASDGTEQPYTIYVPSPYSIERAMAYNGAAGKYDTSGLEPGRFTQDGTVNINDAAGTPVVYKKFVWKGSAGANDVEFKLRRG